MRSLLRTVNGNSRLSIRLSGERLRCSLWAQRDRMVSWTRVRVITTDRTDPNQLFALLQVFPWHVDTLLQMSEVYRLQSGTSRPSKADPRHWCCIRLRRTRPVCIRQVLDPSFQHYVRNVPSRFQKSRKQTHVHSSPSKHCLPREKRMLVDGFHIR